MGMTPDQQEVYDLHTKEGLSLRAIAAKLGKGQTTVRGLYAKAQKWAALDPYIVGGLEEYGVKDLAGVGGGWLIKGDGEGGRLSLRFETAKEQFDIIAAVKDAFNDITPSEPVIAPETVESDLCIVVPLFDVHFGAHAWGRETGGQDYDVKLAASDLQMAVEKVLAITPKTAHAFIIIGGDFLHADDNRSETPQNRHKLDTDGRHHKVLGDAITAMSHLIERVLGHCESATIRVLRGNHDEHSHMVLKYALAQRYRNEPRIDVDLSPMDVFMAQWGRAAIFAHHGDKAPPERLTLYLSDVCRFWTEARHRYCYTGHVHKDQAKDVGPMRWESLRAFCPADSYAAGMGYVSRRAFRIDVYHKRDGRVMTALDPIERLIG